MNSSDVRVFTIRRRPGRQISEVRWRVAGRDKSRSFLTWALADSYRAELLMADLDMLGPGEKAELTEWLDRIAWH